MLSAKPASFTRDPTGLGSMVHSVLLVLTWVPILFLFLPPLRWEATCRWDFRRISLEINSPEQRALMNQRARHSINSRKSQVTNSWELEA